MGKTDKVKDNRVRRAKQGGRKRKNKVVRVGTTPPFAIHPEGKPQTAKKADAKKA